MGQRITHRWGGWGEGIQWRILLGIIHVWMWGNCMFIWVPKQRQAVRCEPHSEFWVCIIRWCWNKDTAPYTRHPPKTHIIAHSLGAVSHILWQLLPHHLHFYIYFSCFLEWPGFHGGLDVEVNILGSIP